MYIDGIYQGKGASYSLYVWIPDNDGKVHSEHVRLLDTAVDSWCGGAVSMGDIFQLCWVLFSIFFLQILFVTVR